jgi:hypothetical protein
MNAFDELSPEMRRVVEGIARESPPHELSQQILESVRRQKPTRAALRPHSIERRATRWNFAAATAVAVAVCVLVLFSVSLFVARVPNVAVVPQMQTAVAQDLPTAWAYHRAIGQSPEAIDALLARHARQVLCPEPSVSRAYVFPYSSQQMP